MATHMHSIPAACPAQCIRGTQGLLHTRLTPSLHFWPVLLLLVFWAFCYLPHMYHCAKPSPLPHIMSHYYHPTLPLYFGLSHSSFTDLHSVETSWEKQI